MHIGRARRDELPPPVSESPPPVGEGLGGGTSGRSVLRHRAVGLLPKERSPTLTLPHGGREYLSIPPCGRTRPWALEGGGSGWGVTLEKAAERAPLSGWRRLPASAQAIGRASTPRPPHPDPPPPRGRES